MTDELYYKKYLKYKNKYINLKAGNLCDVGYQNNLSTPDGKLFYQGITKIKDKKPLEESCNLNDLYQKSRIYLDTLNKFEEFTLWNYTTGGLARLLNNYILHKDNVKDVFKNLSDKIMSKHAIVFTLKWFYFYEIDKDASAKLLNDYYINLLQQILINQKIDNIKTIDNLKILFMKYETENDATDTRLMNIVSNELIKNNQLLKDFINICLDIMMKILNGAPVINRCIRVYKTIGSNKEIYNVGEIVEQKVINSLTCSRNTNIGMFYDSSTQKCCLIEMICKPGMKLIFLNYDKTAYGKKMYEVILFPGYNFKVISKQTKKIMIYDYYSKNKIIKTKNIQPIFDLIYNKPILKDIIVFLLEAII